MTDREYKPGVTGPVKETGRYITFFINNDWKLKTRGCIVGEFKENNTDFWLIKGVDGNIYQIGVYIGRWWYGWVD